MKQGFQPLPLDLRGRGGGTLRGWYAGRGPIKGWRFVRRGPYLFSLLGQVVPSGRRTAWEAPENSLSFMAFSKQSRPPGKQTPGQGCKPSRRHRAWPLPRGSLPRCLRELTPYVPSTSFQSRLLLTSFSWRDNSKKQGMFFLRIVFSNSVAGS